MTEQQTEGIDIRALNYDLDDESLHNESASVQVDGDSVTLSINDSTYELHFADGITAADVVEREGYELVGFYDSGDYLDRGSLTIENGRVLGFNADADGEPDAWLIERELGKDTKLAFKNTGSCVADLTVNDTAEDEDEEDSVDGVLNVTDTNNGEFVSYVISEEDGSVKTTEGRFDLDDGDADIDDGAEWADVSYEGDFDEDALRTPGDDVVLLAVGSPEEIDGDVEVSGGTLVATVGEYGLLFHRKTGDTLVAKWETTDGVKHTATITDDGCAAEQEAAEEETAEA